MGSSFITPGVTVLSLSDVNPADKQSITVRDGLGDSNTVIAKFTTKTANVPDIYLSKGARYGPGTTTT